MNKQIPERLKKANATQIEKYGGVEGYRAEMRRRRALVTTKTGFAIMDTDKVKKAQLKSVEARIKNAKSNKRSTKKVAPKG
jgi:hypothetical protein